MNIGEKNEILAKIMLVHLRDNNEKSIKTVGFEEEYLPIPSGIDIKDIKNYTDPQLEKLAKKMKIDKAPSKAKADVFINGIGYSMKSKEGALPALINHTPRHGILKVCQREGLTIDNLDKAIDNYWDLRIDGEIGQDIKINSSLSPFREEVVKQELKELLAYFLFEGTAMKDSEYKADGMLEFIDPFDFDSWEFLTQSQAIEKYINELTISIRSKGMLKGYNQNSIEDKYTETKPWTRSCNSKLKGSLHVRG